MFCRKCGTESNDKFCPNCGTPLNLNASEVINYNKTTKQEDYNRNRNSYKKPAQNSKHSPMAIIAFVLSFLGPLCVIGLILAIVDLVKDKQKTNKHGLSIAAIIISILVICVIGSSSRSSDKDKTSSPEEKTDSVTESDTPLMQEQVSDEAIISEQSSESILSTNDSLSETSEEAEKPEIPKEDFIASCVDLPYKDLARTPDSFIGQNFKFTAYIMSSREAGILSGNQKYYVSYSFDMDKAQEAVNKGWADSLDDAKIYGMDSDQCVWLLDNRNTDDSDYVKILEEDIVTIYGTFDGLQESKNAITGEKGEQVSLSIKYAELVEE